MTDQANIDWNTCLEKAMGKDTIAQELLEKIISTLPDEKSAMAQAYQQKHYDQLEYLAHQLHGVCCYTGLPRLKTTVRALDVALQSKQHTHLEQLFTEVQHAMDAALSDYANDSYRVSTQSE